MRRIALFLFPLLLLACSKDKEQPRVQLKVNYTSGFYKGCFRIVVKDSATQDVLDDQTVSPNRARDEAGEGAFVNVGVFQREGWSKKVQATVSAHEFSCDKDTEGLLKGKQVGDAATVELDFPGEGLGATRDLTFTTPDPDHDGYLSAANGGTDCDDTDEMRNPSQQEICDDKDNNCAGGVDEGLPKVPMFRDGDGDGVGGEAIQHCVPAEGVRGYATVGGDCKDDDADIAPGKADICDDKDNNCNGDTDENDDKKWYLDNDGDGVPEGPAHVVRCTSPGPKYMKYPSGPPFDCDDADARRAPNKQELCDGIDNNCASDNGVAIDETFPTKGSSCAQGCGTIQCASETSVACNAPEPDLYYQDQDGDGDGVATVIPDVNPKIVCQGELPPASGYALGQDGDCDDRDSARSSIQAELCDGIDNNCSNGVADEPASCGGTLKQVASHHLSSDNQQWNTVSVHASGYPVWVAGENGKLAVRRSASAKFESFSFGDPATPAPTDGSLAIRPNNCGDIDWRVSWMDSSGRVFLGGASGTLAVHNGTADPCALGGTGQSAVVTGLVGFGTTGDPVLYVTDSTGRIFRWILGGAVTELEDNAVNYYGLHGLREEFLLAVGGTTGSGSGQRFRSYAVTPGGAATPTSGVHSSNVEGNARAVWMGTDNKACAVGENGAVWRWNGGTPWTRVEPPGGPVTSSFSSVVMRYDAENAQNPLNEHCYMVDSSTNGRLRRLTPSGTWGSGPDLQTNARLHDLAIAPTGDVWVVGEGGRVFHYPEP
ncbi:putative metal-binding motif-containing protein [Myxococcus faecalis]|uniref:putative metal-binding motif-containing protein n=1 Tax=Myxococcus faecalis TaxID=3115646 RepID=UPI0024C51B12|nr:putative metal-binding motif-containing protein [Myxococcus sp. MH1]